MDRPAPAIEQRRNPGLANDPPPARLRHLWLGFALACCASCGGAQRPAAPPQAPAPLPAAGEAPAPLPATTHTVDGLRAPVEIVVDRWGVSHIRAGDSDDLFFAQGFNAARDRLWQLDLWRRRGEGRLAEAFGPRFVDKDRAARLLLFRGDMYSEWLAYASDTKRIVSSFVAGINAYIALTEQQPQLLPPEFVALDYRPGRWTPETVVRIRSHGLLRNVKKEVSRAVFIAEHGMAGLAFRDHLEPARPHVIPDGLDLSALDESVLDGYRLGTSGVDFDDPGATALQSHPLRGDETGLGSNNWAVSPARTETGRALLADDPHRTQALPSLRYIVHLSAPGLDVIGAGEPALPGVSIGHNGHIAFGLTIFSIDQEDLYVYETRPGRPDEYRYRDRWEPMRVERDAIPVRGQAPVTVEHRFTRHGPVLAQSTGKRRAFALRAAWLEPGMAPYLGSIEYMRARSWDEFLAAMNRWGAPSENQVYADTAGNVGWKPGGRSPIRPNWDGLLPVPGDGRYEWAGYHDMDALPVEWRPARGWVASANQRNVPEDHPVQVGLEWAARFRMQRITEVLDADAAFSVDDALRLQGDYLSIPAREIVAAIAPLSSTEPRVARALELLRGWNGVLAADSAAAALFEVWFRRHLGPALIARSGLPEAARVALGSGHVEVRVALVTAPDGRLGEDPRVARDAAVLESLAAAAAETEGRLGADWSRWRWGDLHRIELRHPLDGKLPDTYTTRLGPLPRGGAAETVGNTRYGDDDFGQISGASFRMVVDVGEWDNSVAMNNPGQSGDPRSPHYGDLFEPWAGDQAFPLLYSRERIDRAARSRIVLQPRRTRAPTPAYPTAAGDGRPKPDISTCGK